MSRWAVFDIDGTLFPKSSLEKEFILFMLKSGTLPPINLLYYLLYGFLSSIKLRAVDAFKSNKYYLRYLPSKSTQTAASNFIRKYILPDLSNVGIENYLYYRSQGYKIMIMSGSPNFLVIPFSRYLTPNFLISCEVEEKNGYYSGKLKGIHPYGKRKTRLLQALEDQLKIDFEDSIVFANHHSDIDHMLLFGKATAVNPTGKLKIYASDHHWEISQW